MNEALKRLGDGAWPHTFPGGKVSQEDAPIRRLKWGTASLLVRAPVTPIVLPIVHCGLEEVMPEDFMFGRSPPFPLFNKRINIVVGKPIEFDIPKTSQMAITMSCNSSLPTTGWPSTYPYGLDEAAQGCLYSSISEKIQIQWRAHGGSQKCSEVKRFEICECREKIIWLADVCHEEYLPLDGI